MSWGAGDSLGTGDSWGAVAPASASTQITADITTSVSWSASLRADTVLPIDQALDLALLHSLPVSWPTELQSVIAFLPVEWQQRVNNDSTVPISLGAVVVTAANAVFPIETLASILVDSDSPIAWGGAVAINADAYLPLEWRNALNTDHTLPLDTLAAVLTDKSMPLSFGAGVVADQPAALAWLASIGVDREMLVDIGGMVVINADAVLPIEWGGSGLAFVSGNTQVWKLDARGVLWRIPGRSVVWTVKRGD